MPKKWKDLKLHANRPGLNTKSRFAFEKHENLITGEQKTKLWGPCTKCDIIVLQNSNDTGFYRIHHKTKLKEMLCHSDLHVVAWVLGGKTQEKDRCRLGTRSISQMNTQRLSSTIITANKKDRTYRLVVHFCIINKQVEKTCRLLPRIIEFTDFFWGKYMILERGFVFGIFTDRTRWRESKFSSFYNSSVPV